MSGLSRTPGKRVWDNIPTGVRIPPSPPNQQLATSANYRKQIKVTTLPHFSVANLWQKYQLLK